MEDDQELPGYTLRASSSQASHTVSRNGSEYTISREDHQGHKWLLLSVKSRAPKSDFLPIFYDGDLISGSVTLNIVKSESLKSITVTAGTTLVGQEEQQFLVIEKELWSPATALGTSKVSKLEKGHYVWPFELTLPEEAEVLDRKGNKTFPLPPSFTERASPAYINYRITVFVRRGALGANQSLTTEFAYVQITRPDLPSPILQLAYQENFPLIGPDGDPDGWHVLPPTSVTGTLFGTKPVNVDFTLALTKPLSYARGSAMPLRLTFTGTDEQALDILSAPHATRVILKRSLDAGSHATSDEPGKCAEIFVEIMARAVFWPASHTSTSGTRVLEGEVQLKKTFKQSVVFPRFAVRYHLDVHHFEVAGFVHAPLVSDPLLTQPVDITSFHAPGISMRSFAPPEYAQEQYENFSNSLGLLGSGKWKAN
ncbi:hypothetical protein AZE42_07084 [Rhizopogon vesiculosus]|uniref:Arrestin-like N-terminal domain-containing protein n=1 Tax=Rhizopogon vesiculosus TaxID=180088 RepID=A0A1J8Q5Y2_9AGAM|nr:hypothetical protein AZE42_07084 [Rhizopogon vesiculosus]